MSRERRLVKLQIIRKTDRALIPLHHLQTFHTQSGLLTIATRRSKITNEVLAQTVDLKAPEVVHLLLYEIPILASRMSLEKEGH